jgi:phosphinothricin acetyltransferase
MPDIRAARPEDLPAITSIYAHYVHNSAATFEIEAPDVSEMERRRSAILAAGLPYLVVTVNEQVSGFAYAGQYRPRAAYRFTVEDSIYLHPDAVGRGLGRTLLGQLIAACEEAGSRQMIAVIGDSANRASIRLHQAFGFRHVGVLQGVGAKFGAWFDTVLMQRELVNSSR